MTNQRSLFNAGAIGVTCLLIAIANGAQARGQNFRSGNAKQTRSPYQQRLSPYLNLLRNDNSVLNPFHSFVRPQQQIQQSFARQGLQLQRLNQAYRSSSIGTQSQNRRPTGNGGSFNNYSHFYPTYR